MYELNGRTAFVTGGASGIGLGSVRALLAEGVKVVAGDVRKDHIHDAQAQLGPLDGLRFITADVTDPASLARAAAVVRDTFGDLHILCNNAGASIIAGAKRRRAGSIRCPLADWWSTPSAAI